MNFLKTFSGVDRFQNIYPPRFKPWVIAWTEGVTKNTKSLQQTSDFFFKSRKTTKKSWFSGGASSISIISPDHDHIRKPDIVYLVQLEKLIKFVFEKLKLLNRLIRYCTKCSVMKFLHEFFEREGSPLCFKISYEQKSCFLAQKLAFIADLRLIWH